MDRDTPTFNLKAVVQETGIKPDTLRAWERRYGLPDPDRSAGGHRLYSQRDIDILIWLMARQDEGLTISRAVDLWQSLESEGQDPLRMAEYVNHSQGSMLVDGGEIKTLADQWINACLNFDERTAERLLAQGFAIYPVEAVCTDVLQTGLRTIGQYWYEGTASVQQEHFASALAMRRIDAMLGAAPLPTRSGRILIACPPGEEHVFSQAVLQLLLRRRGWETIYLGANVPMDRLESSVDIMRPHLIILTAQRLQTAATLKEMATLLHERSVPVAYGGRIFVLIPELIQHIPGHYLGDDLMQGITAVENLVPSAPPVKDPLPIAQEATDALAQFKNSELDISATLARTLRQSDLAEQPPNSANSGLSQIISAGLALGNLDYLDQDISWVEGMLNNHTYTGQELARFLILYAEAVEETIGEKGNLITDWLRGQANTIQHRTDEQMGHHRPPDSKNGTKL